jgi:hypothetical protein
MMRPRLEPRFNQGTLRLAPGNVDVRSEGVKCCITPRVSAWVATERRKAGHDKRWSENPRPVARLLMTDADIIKADLALSELPRAHKLPADQAKEIVKHLAHTTQNDGSRNPDIENAQADAWLSICTVGQSLDMQGHCADEFWDRAVVMTKRWRGLLV